MLLHFQLQELKTEGLFGSVLIALQRYFDSSSCWSCLIQWHFQILRIYLHDVVSYHNHSQPFVRWDSSAPRPLGCWGSGTARYCCSGCSKGWGQGPGRRWNAMGDTQPLLAEFKRPGWAPLPLGYHTYTAFLIPLRARCQPPASGRLFPGTPGSLCSGCAGG